MYTIKFLIWTIIVLLIFSFLWFTFQPHGYRVVQKLDGTFCEQQLAWPNWEDMVCTTSKEDIIDQTREDQNSLKNNKIEKVIPIQ